MKPQSDSFLKKRSKGGSLILFCGLGTLIIGYMGICIYTGLQAFIESDLQRISMNAALAGASRYYSGVGSYGKPQPNSTEAIAYARSTFDELIAHSSLSGFGATVLGVDINDNNDSISVASRATLPTALLTPFGIRNIEVNATSAAKAIKYEPTVFTGPIQLLPDGANAATYSVTLNLKFPMLNGEGTDLYVELPADRQQGYVVEACNQQDCYDLTLAATPVGSGQILGNLIYGSATFDLGKIKVNKATKLRFTHGNNFVNGYFNAGVPTPYTAIPLPLTIQRVMIFNYASTCVSLDNCSIPAGFVPVE